MLLWDENSSNKFHNLFRMVRLRAQEGHLEVGTSVCVCDGYVAVG